MQLVSDLLKSNNRNEPPQVAALKKYARDKHNIDISVRTAPTYYLINVPNAGFAHNMRMETLEITKICKLDKRLVIHIGN